MAEDKRRTTRRGTQRDTAEVDVARARTPRARAAQRKTVPVAAKSKPKPPKQRGSQRDTVRVRAKPRTPRKRSPRSVFTAGAATTGWAAVVVGTPLIVTVVFTWFFAGHPGSVSDAVRAAGAIWLLGHGVPIGLGGGLLGLPPLVITVFLAWRLVCAGGNTAKAIGAGDAAAVRSVLLAVVPPYALIALIVAALVDQDFFTVPVLRSAAHATVFAIVFAGWGALRESGAGRARLLRLPAWLRRGARTGLIAALALAAAGSLAAGVSLAANVGAAADMAGAYGAGGIGVGAVCLLYAPTFGLWGASYLIGPGFAVGTGTTVSLVDVVLGPVPAVPLLTALPTQPAPPAATVLLGVPVAIGVVLGVHLTRRSADLRLPALLWSALSAGVSCGALVALASYAASGPMGTGRLAQLGPHLWQTSLAAAGTIAVAVAFGAVTTRALLGRDRRLRSGRESR